MEPDPRWSEGARTLLVQISRAFARARPAGDSLVAEIVGAASEHFGGRCTIREAGDGGPSADPRGAAVPLVAGGEALGVLSADREAPFRPEELSLLEEVAARAAQALYLERTVRALEAERLARASLQESEHQLRTVTDALPVLVSYVGRDGRYRFVNGAYGRWFGRPAEEIVGIRVEDLVGRPAAEHILPKLAAAMAGERVSYTAEFRRPETLRMAVEYVPHRDRSGEVQGVVVLALEVTGSQRAQERAGFLADASRVLSSSLDVDAALRALAEVAVPRIADLCVIQTVEADGSRRPHTVHAQDPAVADTVRAILQRWPVGPQSSPPRTFRSGESALIREVTDEILAAAAVDPEHLEAMRSLEGVSALVVPVPTSLGPYAVLSLSTIGSRRRFDEADVELAREIAARAGLAIDNARLLREVQEADRAKDEFLAMLGHELRNPLATILTGIELVAELGSPSPAVRRTLGSVERQTTKLARLVDDLLDVSRITRGKIALRREECLLHTLIGRAVDATAALIEARRHALTVDVPEGIALLADPVRIEQVFANLLNNAAKYTEPGGRLRIEARVADDRVEVVVSDDGIGIDPEVLPHVFQPFRQGMVGPDRSYGGLGLGLTLVERLVAMHRGAVRAASGGKGQGSAFTVRLPILAVDRPNDPIEALPRPPVIRSRRVLIVDDNTDAAVATAELLTALGHDVEVAHDGPMALQLAGRSAPEVILLDLGLPGMDGYEVAGRLRAGGSRSRIVALSGYGREQDRRASQRAGFDSHLVKPVTVHTLLSTIAGC